MMRNVKKGDIICYRMGIVQVLKVEADGCWVKDPYGVKQKIDWDDVKQYNRSLNL